MIWTLPKITEVIILPCNQRWAKYFSLPFYREMGCRPLRNVALYKFMKLPSWVKYLSLNWSKKYIYIHKKYIYIFTNLYKPDRIFIWSEVSMSYAVSFCGTPVSEIFQGNAASGISGFYGWSVENNRKTVDSFFRPSPNIANKGFVKFPPSAAFQIFPPHLGDLFQQNSSQVSSC